MHFQPWVISDSMTLELSLWGVKMTHLRISSLLVVGSAFNKVCQSRLFVSFVFLSSPGRGFTRFRACYYRSQTGKNGGRTLAHRTFAHRTFAHQTFAHSDFCPPGHLLTWTVAHSGLLPTGTFAHQSFCPLGLLPTMTFAHLGYLPTRTFAH